MNLSEPDLIARVINFDDHHAFRYLVKKYQSPVRGFLRRLLKNEQLADDVAQDAFLIAYKKIGSFRGGSFKSWLFTIAYREGLKQLTHLNRTYELELYEDTSIIKQILEIDVRKGINTLPPIERDLLVLWLEKDLSHSEISISRKMPIGTVKSILARAKVKMKLYLKGWNYE